MPSVAETYTATAPIIDGNVHQARKEALHLIFLDAGQTGSVQVSTSSALVNMELAESVRWQSSFDLKGFRVVRESIANGALTLVADLQAQNRPVSTCQAAPFTLRSLEYKWQRPANFMEMETETQFRLAVNQAIGSRFSDFLVEQGRPAPYTMQAQLVGTHSFFSRGLKLVFTFLGADGHAIQQVAFPFVHRRITTEEAQIIGSATLRQLHLSAETKNRIAEAANLAAQHFQCFPVVATLQANGSRIISTSSDLEPELSPTVIFSLSWPVMPHGQVDLIKLNTFLEATPIGKRQLLITSPIQESGFLIFQ